MSASDKLKALKGNYTLLAVALPQIVAVMEAAESHCIDCGPCNGGVTPPEDGSPCWSCGHIRAALAALDEQLGDSGSTSPPEGATPLTFADLAMVNLSRARRWHPGFPDDDDWNGADWSNAMCGETGEAANVVKKLRRMETGHEGTRPLDETVLHKALADELADVVIYADLLAAKYGLDLGIAVIAKFNEVSERQEFPERLAVSA